MANPAGEAESGALRLDFDRRLTLQFRGSVVISDAGLLAYRELDDALGLTALAGEMLADARTGKNGRHALVGLLRQSVFGRLAGYEDVNDAERLRHDPAMRWIVGGKAASGCAASASQMGRFETRWLTAEKNLSALVDLSGQWIDKVHARRPPRGVVLDMDSSVSPTHGEQEMSVWNGHYECTCYHPLFVFNQFGDLERCALRPGNVHSADGWEGVLEPVVARYRGKLSRLYFRADAGFANPEVTSISKAKGSNTPFGCLPTAYCRNASAICSNALLAAPPLMSGVPIRTLPIRREAGRSRAASSRKSSGIRANFTRASASSSPTWRGRPRMWSASTTSAARASSGSKRARARSGGRGFPVAHSLPTPSAFSFTRSLTISATSCAHWQRRSRSKTGR